MNTIKPNESLPKSQTEDPTRHAAAVVEESLIVYPCQFPIKVMGANVAGFVDAMALIAQSFDPKFDNNQHLKVRPSKGGNYLGITLDICATNRVQLDELYRTLSTHPMVKMVL